MGNDCTHATPIAYGMVRTEQPQTQDAALVISTPRPKREPGHEVRENLVLCHRKMQVDDAYGNPIRFGERLD